MHFIKWRALIVLVMMALCSGNTTVNAQEIDAEIQGVHKPLETEQTSSSEIAKAISEKTKVLKANNTKAKEKKKDKKKDKKKIEAQELKEEPAGFTAEFLVTAYCPCYTCSQDYGDETCLGTQAEEGRTVAVDEDVIPYGSTVIINGHEYIAEDCGGDIKGHRIDIYMDDHDRTTVWGEKHIDVTVIYE